MNWDCLIVDDEVELAKATCEYFEMFGVTGAYVTDFGGCIDFMKNNDAKLILLDINLGNESGFALCKELRKITDLPEDENRCGNLRIDADAMKVYVNEKDAGFKTKEFRLFHYLYENKNRVITKDELFANIWGDIFFSDGTLNVHIRKVREKIEENPNKPKIIKTIWGTGYMFETPETRDND